MLALAGTIGVATGGGANGGSCPPPTVSRPGPEIIANSLRIFWGDGGGGGKDNLHENICQKLHPDKLKMQQKAFGGRASPGPTGEAYKRSPRLPSRNEGTYL